MFYLKREQNNAIDIINKLGCIRRDQLIKTGVFSSLHHPINKVIESFELLSNNRTHSHFNIIGDTYTAFREEKIDKDMINALDLMLHFDNIRWYQKSEFPFKLSFSRQLQNGQCRLFDVITLKPGDEIIISRMLSSMTAERIIVILDDEMINDYKNIETNVSIKYCLLNPVRFFDNVESARTELKK